MPSPHNSRKPLPALAGIVAAVVVLSALALGWAHILGLTAPSSRDRNFTTVWIGAIFLAVIGLCGLTNCPPPWAMLTRALEFGIEKLKQKKEKL